MTLIYVIGNAKFFPQYGIPKYKPLLTDLYTSSGTEVSLFPPFIGELFTEKEVTENARSNVSIDVEDNDKSEFQNSKSKYHTL